MEYVALFFIALVGYLIGSVNSSIIVGKVIYGIDIRQHGSGNAGATNAFRTLGKKAAAITFLGDFLKGVIACLLGKGLQMLLLADLDNQTIGLMLAGVGSIFGHNWPIYFNFKGGKGVLTSFAVMIMMGPLPTLICFGIFLVLVAVTRYVSLSSMTAAVCLPIVGGIFGDYLGIDNRRDFVVFTVIIAILIIYRHRSNIKRLVSGTENKIKLSKDRKDV